MGIKSLNKFLRSFCPSIFEPIYLNEYKFKKIAIDISLYLCHYKAIYGDRGWLSAFVKLIMTLRENDLHCIFVYDTIAPPEKQAEKDERKKNREKMEDRVSELENAIEKYKETNEIDDILLEFQKKRSIPAPKLLRPGISSINISGIEYAVEKMRKNLFTIRPEDFALTKSLFDILRVPYIDAPGEAETTCSDLCLQGKVDAVLSEDTDVLAYGCPIFLTKINTQEHSCIRINYEKLLEKLAFSRKEFLDFCILCGTDYNSNIFRVGPSKAYDLILNYKSIEKIAEETKYDIKILNHVRTREIFKEYKKVKIYVPYCDRPDFEKLPPFLAENQIFIDSALLEKAFLPQIIFEEEKDEKEEKEMIISGLDYIEDFIDESDEEELLKKIDECEWNTELKRRVQHYGYSYDYKKKSCQKLGQIPKWLKNLMKKFESIIKVDVDTEEDELFNQVIINEYIPGQGISPHTDSSIFGECIATLSLGWDYTMEFARKEEKTEILLKRRSILIMTQDARNLWTHSIPARKIDVVNGKKIQRQRRVSITFRRYEHEEHDEI